MLLRAKDVRKVEGEKKRKEKEGDRGNGGAETRDSKCIVTFEELDYGEHSGERGHELGRQVSIEPARDALFLLDRNSSKNKHVDRETGDPLCILFLIFRFVSFSIDI